MDDASRPEETDANSVEKQIFTIFSAIFNSYFKSFGMRKKNFWTSK